MNGAKTKILIVDDDGAMRAFLMTGIKGEGFEPLEARDGEKALELVKSETPDLMLLDIRLPDMNGMEVLRLAKGIDPNLSVIVLTGYADPGGAASAMKAGALDYLAKPFELKDIVKAIHHALDEKSHCLEIKEQAVQKRDPLEEEMGPSDAVKRILSDVARVAESDFSVVVIGETGSGKELIARAIHRVSPRSKAPFVAVDCGAIPETLLESELFGHEKGAFTGAENQKPGKFELAEGGTLFLDEISNMPLSSQAKLLRVLQEKKVYRVGGTRPIEVDVRLLVASNQDLHALIETGSFRGDLYYRLNEFTITVCPLRERKEDIPYLAKRFLDLANAELRKNVKGFSESALDALQDYPWPGNVRQLRSTIRRATLLADEMITAKQLDLKAVPVQSTPGSAAERVPWQGLSLHEIVQRGVTRLEREVLTEVLKQTGGNKARAARLLQADYKTIHTKVKKLGIRVGEELRDIRHGNRSEEETFESELTPEGLGPEIEEHLNCSVIDDLERRPKQRRLATAA